MRWLKAAKYDITGVSKRWVGGGNIYKAVAAENVLNLIKIINSRSKKLRKPQEQEIWKKKEKNTSRDIITKLF